MILDVLPEPMIFIQIGRELVFRMDECLVIKCDKVLTKEKYDELYKTLIKQANNGILLLPFYCDVVCVPKNMVGDKIQVLKIQEA